MIKRSAETALNDWIINGKDALLLTGARQIGKTYLIRQFLANSGIPYVEFNFIEQPELISLFSDAKNTQDLLMRLSLITPTPLEKGKTIIFLDEIQEFKDIAGEGLEDAKGAKLHEDVHALLFLRRIGNPLCIAICKERIFAPVRSVEAETEVF